MEVITVTENKPKTKKSTKRPDYIIMDKNTKAIVFGFQTRAIQRMLDFDYICRREEPSVVVIVNPTRDGMHKCFWGTKEILIPMVKTLKEAAKMHPEADFMVNFASFRSAYQTSKEGLETKTIRSVAIIAEGIPEQRTKKGKLALQPLEELQKVDLEEGTQLDNLIILLPLNYIDKVVSHMFQNQVDFRMN